MKGLMGPMADDLALIALIELPILIIVLLIIWYVKKHPHL